MDPKGAVGGGSTCKAPVAEALFNHLVLPPKLPDRPEFISDDAKLPDALASLLLRACRSLQHVRAVDPGTISTWKIIEKSLSSTRVLRGDHLGKQTLLSAFHDLIHYDDAAWLALHVAQQNSGLLIHRDSSNGTIVFEAFEISAPPSKVLEAIHALSWSFPARVVAVPLHVFADPSFGDNLASFLEQAGTETFDRFAAKVQKGGATITESRDCPGPDLICQMLMSLLEGLGSAAVVQQVTKKVRDDVVLSSAQSERPWRRSPDWLLLRVSLSRLLITHLGHLEPGIHRVYYKFLLCAAFALFLKDCAGVLSPDKVFMLRSKLCRRLAKLDTDRSSASGLLRSVYESFFDGSSDFFNDSVSEVATQITKAWTDFKAHTTRAIPLLPTKARDNETKLSLVNSGGPLLQLLAQKSSAPTRQKPSELPILAEGTVSQVHRLAQQHSRLVDHERSAIHEGLSIDWESPEESCTILSRLITQHREMVGNVFQGDALLMSRHLLVLFSLWVGMDLAATAACPLLLQYHPGFMPESLDSMCLPTLSEMERLQRVQVYLADRIEKSREDCGTIFDHPRRSNAFPVQFVRTTSAGVSMVSVGRDIDEASTKARKAKEIELRNLKDEYDDLTEEIRNGVCICVRTTDGTMDVRGCHKCFCFRKRRRLAIRVHEDFLPSTDTEMGDMHRAAILFELLMPRYLRHYRTATWMLKMLGCMTQPTSTTTPALLLEYSEALAHRVPKSAFDSSLTLASKSKSFLQTHYKELKLPKRLEEVVLPFGASFAYYDHVHQAWTDEIPSVPWYETLLGPWVPKGLPNPYEFAEGYIDAETLPPSSYNIVARATQHSRPDDMSVHEFSALQRILSSRGRRWLEVLAELGSPNINFSSSVAAALINHIAIQAGPSTFERGLLREAHIIFSDEAFCGRLLEQLTARLNTLAPSSWREVQFLSIIVTLALRLYLLCPPGYKTEANKILRKIRDITSNWINVLRKVVRSTSDAGAAQKAATCAFWSALLCRQTFSIYENDGDENPGPIEAHDVQCFFRASITLQENILVDLDQLDKSLKQRLVRDLISTYRMREVIQEWMNDNPSALESAISETWSDVGGASRRQYSAWARTPGQDDWWVKSRTAKTRNCASQVVHFHFLEGHLLVDGKPLGRLPLEMTDDAGVREIFGKQHLLTRPSNLDGMQYRLTNTISSHEIHFGTGGGRVIIRARLNGSLWEYVPRAIFKGEVVETDLPASLVDDCVHWLNLNTGELQCRRKPKIWQHEKKSNWVLDVRERRATRHKEAKGTGLHGGQSAKRQGKRGSYLVEPRSRLGQQIANIFRGFEDLDKLTIYQPIMGRLTVEMKRLEIRFIVNSKKLLFCPQLKAEVDPIQDAGTLYGLSSKIVLRSISNEHRKSILVPRGQFFWERNGMHVKVTIANQGTYARFTIDSVLGRLTCAPEPRLLYMKAALHALTSFPIPDCLTLRTGTEEARECLRAASSQHWGPLDPVSLDMLSVIRSLAPERSYYPRGKKLYQKVAWIDGLTMTVQNEGLVALVDIIRQESDRLQRLQPPPPGCTQAALAATALSTTPKEHPEDCDCDACHLRCRGRLRRQLYERLPEGLSLLYRACATLTYVSRDRELQSQHSTQVYRTTSALVLGRVDEEQFEISHTTPLTSLLGGVENIGGFLEASAPLDIQLNLDSDLRVSWGSHVQTCRLSGPDKHYDVVFLLGLLAFGQRSDMRLLKWLLSLACKSSLRAIEPPEHASFGDFQPFEKPSKDVFVNAILCNQPGHIPKKSKKGRHHTGTTFKDTQKEEAEQVAALLLEQWPDVPESLADLEGRVEHLDLESIDLRRIWKMLHNQMQRLSHNHSLSEYLSRLEATARNTHPTSGTIHEAATQIWKKSPQTLLCFDYKPRKEAIFSVPQLADDLAMKPYNTPDQSMVEQSATKSVKQTQVDPLSSNHKRHVQAHAQAEGPSLPQEISILKDIVANFRSSSNATRQQYGVDLQQSLDALIENRMKPQSAEVTRDQQVADLEVGLCRRAVNRQFANISEALCQGETGRSWLVAGNLMPCISPVTLLILLRQHQQSSLSRHMRQAIVQYGVRITELQRLLRMRDALLCKDYKRVLDEQRYEGHLNWQPMDHPDWLLIEIDSDILIREVQVDVARAIISPSSQQNSVLQMNMGQGKTSCIVPMAMTALADRSKLCRLIVPAPLLIQTAQVLQTRLGGLVGRVVRHVPFARRTRAGSALLDEFERVHQQALRNGGVMLCLPEHIMSFKLSGLQKLVDGTDNGTAKRMIDLQNWFERSCRDVVDESDYTLSTKTQLIYPNGSQSAVDGHPLRWQVIQDLLLLTESHANTLERQYPRSIQITRRHKGYPILHFLKTDVEDALNDLLVDDICHGRLPFIRLKDLTSSSQRDDLRQIVCGADASESTWARVAQSLEDDTNTGMKILCLVRGLLSQGILVLCLKKRWNVQYGLHSGRAPISVPFEAKGVPSQTAEYGHPDTALVLTCLSFYQTGLTKGQVRQSLQHVMRSDDPASHYETWIQGSDSLPHHLRGWNQVNADDEAQVEELWNHLRFNRNVANGFMNTFVFPAHAKQFETKLQASGWDIPLLHVDNAGNGHATESTRPGGCQRLTTGFSGTNDNKRILPKTIKQNDLLSLVQTNAEVLTYLLERRNQTCIQAVQQGSRLSEQQLLELLQKSGPRNSPIRVLIDAGAYILEMENAALADAWLAADPDAQGAVYFDHEGRIMVRARFQKMALPLLASPFADNLEDCVVYIDEAHTRGTDLKLPPNAMGAVTLGLGQTKDKTVQAAMRLRQLGSSQSVAFIAPPEVYQSIVDLNSPQRKNKSVTVTSVDVVRWLLEQSCKANESMLSLYVAQGMDFCRRSNALWKASNNLATDTEVTARVLRIIQQREEETLEALYGNGQPANHKAAHFRTKFPLLKEYAAQLGGEKAAGGKHSSAFEEVEQEREVEFEVEQVRERQRSTGFKPLEFPGLSDALHLFVKTGILDDSNGDFVQAFDYVGGTTIGKKYGVQGTTSKLYVTAEFCRIVSTEVASQDCGKKSKEKKKNAQVNGQAKRQTEWSMMRPVQWILWNPKTQTAVVVIPEEAEMLLPALRGHPKVHLLIYAAPVTKSMTVFNSLRYYTVPSMKKRASLPIWLRLEIGIIAGRLYIGFDEYRPLLAWLDLESGSESDDSDPSDEETSSLSGGLKLEEPLAFLMEWLTHNRQTDDISHTPMGFICQRRTLHKDHSFFSTLPALHESSSEDEMAGSKHGAHGADLATDEDDDSSDTSEEDMMMAHDELDDEDELEVDEDGQQEDEDEPQDGVSDKVLSELEALDLDE